MAPTPSAAEGSPTGEQERPGGSPGFLLAGPLLWWRGLKVAWRARWPFWLPILLGAVNATLRLIGQRGCFRMTGSVLQEAFPSSYQHRSLEACLTAGQAAAPYLWSFLVALPIGGDVCLPVVLVFALCLWKRMLVNPRTAARRRIILPALASAAALTAYVTLRVLWRTWFRPWYEVAEAGNLLEAVRQDLMESLVFTALWWVFLGVSAAWLGSLFWLAATKEDARPSAALITAANRLWLVAGYFAVAIVPPAALEYWAGPIPDLGPILVAARAWPYLLFVVGSAFPFLAISGKAGLWSTLGDTLEFCWERAKQFVALWAVATVPVIAIQFCSSLVWHTWTGPRLWAYLLFWGIRFPELVLSIGGCMGMFLLIEEWRADMNGDRVSERQPFRQLTDGDGGRGRE